ncbi:MAG: tripartite tricarboxylate transporter substrate binding protein [Burkholderiales bacterium]|nr:tripartite tricarboxylate transporter substrate binding protein [Burkholderiales bacterium]
MRSIVHAISTLALAAMAVTVSAQPGYPSRLVRVVIPFGAGGGNDIVARVLSAKLADSFGQPVIVENRPGAQGFIAGELVAKSAPDGHTVLMGSIGPMVIGPAIYRKMPFSTLRDFAPITMIGSYPLILIVNLSSPAKSVSDLLQYAKVNAAKINYGSASPSFQLTTELFKLRTGTAFQHIPYKSSAELVNAVLGNEITMAFQDPPPALGVLKAGRVRALAVTGPGRHAALPDVPTMAEAGVRDMVVMMWMGLFMPAAAPPMVVQRFRDEVVKALATPDVRDKLAVLGIEPSGMQPAEFQKFIAAEMERWSTVAKDAGIKGE